MNSTKNKGYEWLEVLYDDKVNLESRIDLLFEITDRSFSAGKFEYIDNLLSKIELEKLPNTLVIGILSSCNPASQELKNWNKIKTKIKNELNTRPATKNRVKQLMKGF